MQRVWETIWETGFRLRCPVCEQGALFINHYTMHKLCPHCKVRFERYEGEVVGGMSVSIVVTSVIFFVGVFVTEFVWHWPLWLSLGMWVGYAILFPIWFYRYSRALWVALLHINGDVYWDQEPYQESQYSILDAFFYNPDQDPPSDPPNPSDDDGGTPEPQPTPR